MLPGKNQQIISELEGKLTENRNYHVPNISLGNLCRYLKIVLVKNKQVLSTAKEYLRTGQVGGVSFGIRPRVPLHTCSKSVCT